MDELLSHKLRRLVRSRTPTAVEAVGIEAAASWERSLVEPFRGLSPAQKLFRSLVMRGAGRSRTVAAASWVPYCDNPVVVHMAHRSGRHHRGVEATMQAPCRKCPKCLQFRQMRWRQRAINEIAQSKRTWFVTLTFSPVQLAGVLLAAKSGSLADVEASAYADVQKFFKRVRKECPAARFRYVAIYERGEETGRSHYHLLLHEVGIRPVLKAVLERQWPSFVHARLVTDADGSRRASYVTKYLTKSLGIRPRASLHYGAVPNVNLGKKKQTACSVSPKVVPTQTKPSLSSEVLVRSVLRNGVHEKQRQVFSREGSLSGAAWTSPSGTGQLATDEAGAFEAACQLASAADRPGEGRWQAAHSADQGRRRLRRAAKSVSRRLGGITGLSGGEGREE